VLLRLLFPSWAFFDTVAAVPTLEVRVLDGDRWSDWLGVLQAPPRPLRSLLYNPEGTLHLALQQVVDRFAVEQSHEVQDTVTHDMTAAIAERAAHQWIATGEAWAWRVVMVMPGADADQRVLYTSDTVRKVA
jgi:hypothetical protein